MAHRFRLPTNMRETRHTKRALARVRDGHPHTSCHSCQRWPPPGSSLLTLRSLRPSPRRCRHLRPPPPGRRELAPQLPNLGPPLRRLVVPRKSRLRVCWAATCPKLMTAGSALTHLLPEASLRTGRALEGPKTTHSRVPSGCFAPQADRGRFHPRRGRS